MLSLLDMHAKVGGDHRVFNVTLDELTSAAADVGNNWERAPLRHVEGREGWEESLFGCLKDVSRMDITDYSEERVLIFTASTQTTTTSPVSARL